MANEEHMKILKKGVTEWNRWREENPHSRPDLEKATLNGANLHGANLSRADLRGADLTLAYLRRADLLGTDLKQADLKQADLNNADLDGVNLAFASLYEADLSGADLSRADLRGADLVETVLKGARMDLPQSRTSMSVPWKGLKLLRMRPPRRLELTRSIGRKETFLRFFFEVPVFPVHHLHEVVGRESHRVLFLLYQLFDEGPTIRGTSSCGSAEQECALLVRAARHPRR